MAEPVIRLACGSVSALGLAGVITLQAAVGIATLLAQSPIGLALTHQGVAVVVLTLAVLHAQRQVSGGRRSEAAEGTTLLSRA